MKTKTTLLLVFSILTLVTACQSGSSLNEGNNASDGEEAEASISAEFDTQ